MASSTLTLPANTRYKDTPMYVGDRGNEFGLMEVPSEFQEPTSDYKQHRVRQDEIGFLDIIAVRYYGDGMEELWWVIALANDLLDYEMEMFVGQVLLIPPREKVVAFLSRLGANAV
jgi:hypothetical protein